MTSIPNDSIYVLWIMQVPLGSWAASRQASTSANLGSDHLDWTQTYIMPSSYTLLFYFLFQNIDIMSNNFSISLSGPAGAKFAGVAISVCTIPGILLFFR
jgi:hypothetical protein